MKTDNITSSFMALRDKLHRSALGFLKNDEDAEDVLQDTFFRLYRTGAVGSDAEARNKLFAVLRNLCIDRLRKPRTVSIDDPDSGEDRLVALPGTGEDMVRYEALLTSGLSGLQRRIYTLVVHDGMEYEAVASALGMSVEAVRMNMSRARGRIRDNYKKLDR